MANQVKKPSVHSSSTSPLLWAAAGILLVGLLIVRTVYPELLWLTGIVVVLLIGALGVLIQQNQKALKSRTAAYGFNSFITILLVLGIVGVLDFITSRYPLKWDLTKNKIHSLSDQTVKLIKTLPKPVKANFFSAPQQKDQAKLVLDNYKSLNPKFEVEYVDVNRELTRTKQAGIKKAGTLQLVVGTRENKIEELTEEKITNALIKLLKDKSPTLCVTTGHGEKSFNSQEAEGYSQVKKALTDQSYEVKEITLLQEGKIPETCDAVAVVGATKSFTEQEEKLLKEYLDNGGRGVVALDLNLRGGEYSPELISVLKEWHIHPQVALIIDPVSKMLGADASFALLANFSKENSISKDFQANCLFPLTRPLDIMPNAPVEMHVQWLAQSTPKSLSVSDTKQLASGEIKIDPQKDKAGPFNAAVAVEGKKKDSKAARNTRLAVFGSSLFATNNYGRMVGNLDFFVNSISWVMEDESLISIRAKEEGPGKVELSQKAGTFIFLLTVILVPLATAVSGFVIWMVRRRL